MPLYEYACPQCDHAFEALVFTGDVVECPKCQNRDVERQLSVPARPQTGSAPLPLGGCDPGLPPCGPGCCRLPADD
jgi:putative FmdB family regulatory protein